MGQGFNLIGPKVVKYRYQRGWTQDLLAAKLQRVGCDVSAQVLANIETQRSGANDTLIGNLAKVFKIGVEELFPLSWQGNTPSTVEKVTNRPVGCQRKKAQSK